MENDKKENCLILGITLLLVLSGIALRLYGLRTRNLEYDEIWTFAHYVKLPLREIFTELAVPNNHPLNTLFIKYSVRIAGAHQLLQLRLPALLAGLFLLGGSWFALRRLTRSTAGACFGMLLLALNIPLIHYSQTARGYELQALFTAGVMLSLIFFELDRKSQYRRILWPALFLISAVATCLSVTSGVIFVTALALSYVCLFTDFRKLTDMKEWLARKELLTAFFFFAVFVILWYGLNYRTLAQGQSFGNTVTSPVKFLTFVWNTVTQLPLTLTIPAVLAASVLLKDPFKRRIALMGLFSTALVFCSALIFKAGDFRVYIPLIPILAFPAALIFESLTERLRRFSLLVFCLLTVIVVIQSNAQYPKMNPPDHSRGGAGHLFPDGLLCHCFTFQERVPDGPVEADQSRPCFPDSDGRHGFNRNISGMEKQYFRLPGTRKSAHAGKPRRGNRLFGVSSASAAKRRIIERKISGRPD